MAVGNYGGRISPLPMRKRNFKCSVAAAWAMLLTSVFAMNWVDFSPCLYCLQRYKDALYETGGGIEEWMRKRSIFSTRWTCKWLIYYRISK